MDNIYKAVQLTIDSQNLALSKTPTHVYIANQYVDTNDTPLITAPFIIQKALENGTGVVDIVSSTIGSIYEVRLLCDAEVLISGYFYMPPMNVNFSELELYTSYPPRTPPVVNEFWQKTENFILEKTNTLLNFVQVFNSLSSMRLSLGYLEELLTTKKSNLVSAINEVYKRYEGVGDLYEKNVAAGAGANGWTAELIVDKSEATQQQVNYNGGSKWHSRVGGYLKNERAVLANGDIVKSTIDGNTNDPNVNMTGWELVHKKSSINTVAELSTIQNPKDGDVVYVKSYYTPTNFALAQPFRGGGQRIYVESRKTENDGFLCINGWVLVQDSINEFTPEHAGANNTDSSDTQALKKLFSLAYTQPISIVLQRMYSCTESLTCYYVQTHNQGFSIKGSDVSCGITFKGALSNQVLIDIHGYHADISGFRINEQTNHANTNIGMRYCGENISVDGIVARGYFKKVVLGVAALKSKFSNLDIQTADNTDENFVGIGLQLAACVNTSLTGTSYIGRTDCPLVLGLLDGETYEALKPPNLSETITWNCEGVGIEGIKSVKSNTGMILQGLEIQVSSCISDFNKFKFFTLEGQLIKITDSWFACDNNTPANQEMIGSTGTGCAYATLTNNTFDSGQATAQGQTATFNFPYSTYIANMSYKMACTINSQNEALCLFNKRSITGGTPEWAINNLSDNSIVLPRTGKSRFSNGINIGKNAPTTNSKLAIRIDGGETALEIFSALGTILSTCEGGLVVSTVNPDNNNVLKVGSINSSGRSIAATGTINASGADYAEYMLKSETCGIIKAGDICGINADGELTDKYDEAVDFAIKSTNPSIVGGDTWSNIPNHPKKPVDATADELELYEKSLAEWQAAFHAVRARYDRIAFCGQVPVNVLGGKSGDYLIPMKLESGSIGGYYVASPSFEEFMVAVGKVITGNIVKVVMH